MPNTLQESTEHLAAVLRAKRREYGWSLDKAALETGVSKAMLGQIEHGLNKEKKQVEQSHLSYATGQLAVYEESKDTVKRLASQGLNLAGKFLDNAMQAAGKGQGRGRQ